MRALMCGSLEWLDQEPIETVIVGLMANATDGLTIVCGGTTETAQGADLLIARVAETLADEGEDVQIEDYPVNWMVHDYENTTPVPCYHWPSDHCPAAGPRRNQAMLDQGKPDVGYAFCDHPQKSKGTADMLQRARWARLPMFLIQRG